MQKGIFNLCRHWLAYINVFWAVLVGLPWLAPVLMQIGATGRARIIYSVYRYLCHQLANRSFFLFGSKAMYSYTDLLPYASDVNTYEGLRAFIGNAELGYKVAWSDRMVSLYGGFLLGGFVFALLRRYLTPSRWVLYLVMVIPMFLDGTTHVISDLSGVGQGFRYTNAWLAALTGDALPASFYTGTDLGSFNSTMRLLTGLLAGLGTTWMLYSLFDIAFSDARQTLEAR
jgi:uncharacterized membrane protein